MKIGKYLGKRLFLKRYFSQFNLSAEIDLSAKSLQECLTLLTSDPDNLQIKIRIIQLCVAEKRMNICEPIVEELNLKYPKSLAVNSVLGRWYAFVQNYNAARVKWKLALEKNPELPDALVGLAQIDIAEQKFDDALSRTENILVHSDQSVRRKAHIIRVRVYEAVGDQKREAQSWKELLSLEPENLIARLSYVRCVFRQRQFEELLPVLDSSIALHPEAVQFQLTKSDCLLRLGKQEQALEILNSLCECDIKSIASIYKKASLLKKMGRIEEAEYACAEALSMQPDHVPTLVLYARIAQSNVAAA